MLLTPLVGAYFWWKEPKKLFIKQKRVPIPKKKIRVPKKNSKQLVITGDTFCNQGDIARAIIYYKKAVKKNRQSPQVNLHLALALTMHGNINQAIEAITHVSIVSPPYFRSFCTLGFLMYHTTLLKSQKQAVLKNKAILKQIVTKYLNHA
jgi:predicted Zn-dependent protease